MSDEMEAHMSPPDRGEYVFIAHANREDEKCKKLADAIERHGIRQWHAPRNLPTGEDYRTTITEKVRGCSVLVYLVSRASHESEWVRHELSEAEAFNKPVLPVRLEPGVRPLLPWGDRQFADWTQGDSPGEQFFDDLKAQLALAESGRFRGSLTEIAKAGSHVGQVAWSPDGAYLAMTGADRQVALVALAEDGPRFRLGDVLVRSDSAPLAWSFDSRALAVGGPVEIPAMGVGSSPSPPERAVCIWIWEIDKDRPRHLYDLDRELTREGRGEELPRTLSVAWPRDANDRVAIAVFRRFAGVLDAERGMVLSRFRRYQGEILSLSWSPDGRHIATGHDNGQLRIFESSTGDPVDEMRIPGAADWPTRVEAVSWSPDGGSIACGTASGSSWVWEPPSGAAVRQLAPHDGFVKSIAWSADGSLLATAGGDGAVTVHSPWGRVPHYQPVLHLDGQGNREQVLCLSWSPSGRQIATATSSGRVRIVDLWAEPIAP